MAPTSVNAPAEDQTRSSVPDPGATGTQGVSLPPAGAGRSSPGEAEMAAASAYRPPSNPQLPLPPGLEMEPSARVGGARSDSDTSGAELKSLLANAHNADTWSDIPVQTMNLRSSHGSSPPPSAMADYAAGRGQAQRTDADVEPGSPPPDIEPAAAKKPERRLSQAGIYALQARWLGG